MTNVSLERRRELVAMTGWTLNGAPAAVSGARLDFAKVSDSKTGLSAEWSWEAVEYVLAERSGAFKT